MTQVVQYSETGSPDVLRVVEVETPQPGVGQVLVSMRAIGVNPLDAKLRSGIRPSGPLTGPRGIGFDGAGVVTALGEGVSSLAVGDHVLISRGARTYASDVVVAADAVDPIPQGVTDAQAAALPIPAGTAYQVLKSLAVTGDDVVVYHGGSGAVGHALIQFARTIGATVIATASPKNHERLGELGATPVDYTGADADELAARIQAAASAPITVVIDGIGADDAINASLKLGVDPNRIATIVRGADAPGFGIRAFGGGSSIPLTEQEQQWRLEGPVEAMRLIAAGEFKVAFSESLPLSESVAAHRLIESQHAGGKIILVP